MGSDTTDNTLLFNFFHPLYVCVIKEGEEWDAVKIMNVQTMRRRKAKTQNENGVYEHERGIIL